MQIPEARIYMYGKEQIRDKRKMGHVLFLGHDIDKLMTGAQHVQNILFDNHEDQKD